MYGLHARRVWPLFCATNSRARLTGLVWRMSIAWLCMQQARPDVHANVHAYEYVSVDDEKQVPPVCPHVHLCMRVSGWLHECPHHCMCQFPCAKCMLPMPVYVLLPMSAYVHVPMRVADRVHVMDRCMCMRD